MPAPPPASPRSGAASTCLRTSGQYGQRLSTSAACLGGPCQTNARKLTSILMAAAGQPKAAGLSFRRRARLPVEASLMKFFIVQNDILKNLVLCERDITVFAAAGVQSGLSEDDENSQCAFGACSKRPWWQLPTCMYTHGSAACRCGLACRR